jgi:uncharacterized caspase-like protein
MPRRIAIVIGVGNVPGLTPLAGTATGVEDFAQWAVWQGFELLRFDDSTGEKVLAEDITHAVKEIVKQGGTERMFIFFAGHGFTAGLLDDLWLLSNADEDASEAINVPRSVQLAWGCGIPHVVFFADACRSPATRQFSGVQGRALFPTTVYPNVDVEVDQFYATVSGDPAFEKQPADSAQKAFGVFSRCLIPALKGEASEVIETVADGLQPRAVISQPLGRYLKRRVRLVAATELQVVQRPQCIPTSLWKPNVLAWLSAAATPPATPSGPQPDTATATGPERAPDRGPDEVRGEPEPLAANGEEEAQILDALDAEDAAEFDSLSSQYQSIAGRSRFETHNGLSVVGGRITRTAVTGGDQGVFLEAGAEHVRGHEQKPAAALVRIRPGQARASIFEAERESGGESFWAGVAMFPDYVGTLAVTDNGIDLVSYVPIPGSDSDQSPQVARRVISRMVAAARLGMFDPNDEETRHLWAEDLNPTAAVLAAYHFDRIGKRGVVRDMLHSFEEQNRPVPFDLVLLANVDPDEVKPTVTPLFPLMTRGWALAETLPGGREEFRQARKLLLPTPWTTLRDLSDGLLNTLVELQPTAMA